MMATEDELKDLREKNNELVQKVQYWKMTAAQRENEKLDLMKEINELRLKLSRLRSNGNVQASNFDAALQSASEKALAHLVRASSEIATSMELAKAYMRDRQELDANSPRWSSIGSTPSSDRKDKVHRVPPLMMGGQSIQPVVSLSRTMLDISSYRATTRNSNINRNVRERVPVPMHMLQDVYIPLTRIDADLLTQNIEPESEPNSANNSTEDLLDGSNERDLEESERMSEDEDYDSSRVLAVVSEDLEPEEDELTPPRNRMDNPLEGPSWMFDASTDNQASTSISRTNLEPDSTTEPDGGVRSVQTTANNLVVPQSARTSTREFSPTVRRRKRTSSPAPAPATPPAPAPRRVSQYSPRPVAARRTSNSGRVLKVLVAKMSLEEAVGGAHVTSPPKRRALSPQFDAPSPNGATVAGVIVSEANESIDDLALDESGLSRRSTQHDQGQHDRKEQDGNQHDRVHHYERSRRERRSIGRILLDTADATRTADSRASSSRQAKQDNGRSVSRVEQNSRTASRYGSNESRDSDSSGGEAEGRTRRTRKVVTYKEKPLNRKMRR